MIWIKYRKNDSIPEELYYADCYADKNKDGKTPLMLWKEYHPNEPIPEKLYYDGC